MTALELAERDYDDAKEYAKTRGQIWSWEMGAALQRMVDAGYLQADAP